MHVCAPRRFSPRRLRTRRPLGLIDRAGCFRPLGRPRCRGVAGQLAADADMAVRFHVRSITRDALATLPYALYLYTPYAQIYIVRWRKCISCSTDDIPRYARCPNERASSFLEKATRFVSLAFSALPARQRSRMISQPCDDRRVSVSGTATVTSFQ